MATIPGSEKPRLNNFSCRYMTLTYKFVKKVKSEDANKKFRKKKYSLQFELNKKSAT